jgi:hypothetical protein
MSHHRPRPRDPHAPVTECDFLHGYRFVYGLTHDDPKRLRLMMLERLEKAFPFHPALPERILLRLGALAEIWRHPVMESWKTAPATAALGDTVLRVAASHPMSATGWFDPQSFFAEMLRRMNGEGCA